MGAAVNNQQAFQVTQINLSKAEMKNFPGHVRRQGALWQPVLQYFLRHEFAKHEICSIVATVFAAWKWYDIRPA